MIASGLDQSRSPRTLSVRLLECFECLGYSGVLGGVRIVLAGHGLGDLGARTSGYRDRQRSSSRNARGVLTNAECGRDSKLDLRGRVDASDRCRQTLPKDQPEAKSRFDNDLISQKQRAPIHVSLRDSLRHASCHGTHWWASRGTARLLCWILLLI